MRDARVLLPLKPLVFQILLVLAGGDRHGWRLMHELQPRVLPGNFYRVLKSLIAEGLIEEVSASKSRREQDRADTGANAERRRYVSLTPFGRDVAKAEAHRLEALVAESRDRRLLSTKRPAR
jgi:DNA-binding MarR family transcriptional regulator